MTSAVGVNKSGARWGGSLAQTFGSLALSTAHQRLIATKSIVGGAGVCM